VESFDVEYDLVVLGSGASGMTAALVAAVEGARVLVLESSARVGGTSARSSGTLWIPQPGDAAAATYLDALVGEKADRSLREAFLAAYRWQYIVSGVQVPRFGAILGSLTTVAQRERIGAALTPVIASVGSVELRMAA